MTILQGLIQKQCTALSNVNLSDRDADAVVAEIEGQIIATAMLMCGYFYDSDQCKYVKAMNEPERM